MLADFHFLRPEWLLAIPVVAIILFVFYRRSRQSIGWEKVCDPALLNFQLTHTREAVGSASRLLIWLVPLMFLIAILALAGPSWQKKQQPIFQKDSALVIVLDLSLSMNARDVKPSRLERAKLKIIDILKQKKEGQTALVAYAGDAHTVSPLTIDNKTIISLLPALDSSIMPLSGSHAADAIKTAKELLVNAGYSRGDILLFTDGIDVSEQQKVKQLVKQLNQQGYHTSVIGIGTQAGSPIPIPGQGGFIKDRSGQVILSKLEEQPLKAIAQAGGGFYHRLSLDDSDFKEILEQKFIDKDKVKQQDEELEQWIDAGAYVTLLVIPLALFMFRKGVLSLLVGSLLVSSLLLPAFYSAPVMAEPTSEAAAKTAASQQPGKSGFNWNDLWLTPDQQADKSFKEQNYQQAAETFKDPLWKASAYYRAGQYEQALQQYSQFDSADALYNKGNALANLQKFPEAIKAYEQALKQNPELKDAKKNLEYLKKLLEQQKQQSGQNSQDQQDQKDQSQQNDSQQNQQQDQSGNKQDSQSSKESGDDSQQQDQKQQNEAGKNQDKSQNSESESDSEHESSEQDKNQEQKNQSSEQQQQADQNAQQDNRDQQSSQAQQPDSEEDIEKAREQAAQAAQARDNQSEQQDQEKDQHNEQAQAPADVMSQLSQEEQQSMKQWLQRIPDNPGELLRIKFRNNTLIKQRQQQTPQQYEGNPW